MTKKIASGCSRTPLSLFYRSPRLMLGLSLISGLSIFSSSLVIAQTDSQGNNGSTPPSIPVKTASAPAPEPPAERKQVVTTIVVPVTSQPRANQDYVAPAPPPAPVAAKKPVPQTSQTTSQKPSTPRRTSQTTSQKPSTPRQKPETAKKPATLRRTSQTAYKKPATLRRTASALGSAITVPKKPVLAAPELSTPDTETVAQPPKVEINPTQTQESAKVPESSPPDSSLGNTDSNLSATGTDEKQATVILTDRSVGCRTVSQNGQLLSGICGKAQPSPQQATRPTGTRDIVNKQTANRETAIQPTVSQPRDNAGNILVREPQLAQAPTQEPKFTGVKRLPGASVAATRPVNIGSTRLSPRHVRQSGSRKYTAYVAQPQPVAPLPAGSLPISEGWTSPTGLDYYNVTARPAGRPNTTNAKFMFPLAVPSAITSLFGWRIHPVTGDYRFHAGTDMGAPEGTPVMAAVAGQVITADFMGGYGLTVVVQHEDGNNVSLYAHLSEIFVQPGEQVEQGNVIGRVGNTGLSTGPHLHFEWRHMTPNGWIALDATPNIDYALAQFVKSIQVAQAPQQPGLIPPQSVSQQPVSQRGF